MILLIVTGIVPSVYVMLQGAVPVKVTLSAAVCPLHIVFVPLSTAVCLGFTVITALPVIPAGNATHLLSFTDVKVYVLLDAGDTVNV